MSDKCDEPEIVGALPDPGRAFCAASPSNAGRCASVILSNIAPRIGMFVLGSVGTRIASK